MHFSNNFFDLTLDSLPEPSKTKCGDYCAFHFMEPEKWLILTLADGVGSNVCDWKASKVACEMFIKHFTEKKSSDSLSVRIEDAIRVADTAIMNEEGHCKGMKTTFLAVVWDFEANQIFYTGIGDSRIYSISDTEVLQITKDETASIVRKGMDGKPLVFAGVTVAGDAVTNVLGALVSCNILKMEDANMDGLLLASDGFYGCQPTLVNDILTITNHENMDPAFQKVVQSYRQYQKDDMTAIVVRKKESPVKTNPISLVQLIEGDAGDISKYSKIKMLSDGLDLNIEQKNAEICKKIMDFCQKEGIVFDHENAGAKIKEMVKRDFQEVETYRGLVNMIRINH